MNIQVDIETKLNTFAPTHIFAKDICIDEMYILKNLPPFLLSDGQVHIILPQNITDLKVWTQLITPSILRNSYLDIQK